MRTAQVQRRSLLAAVAAGTSLALLASCGGSSNGSDPAPSSSGTLSNGVLKAVLLTAEDIGGDFQARPAPDSGKPLPCAAAGTGTLDQQAPPALQARTVLLSPSLEGQLNEQLKVYGSAADASAALAVYIAGFACPTGTLYSADGSTEPLTISGPSDATAQVGVPQIDGVVGWELTSAEVGGLAIAAQYGATLLLLTFANPIDADPAAYPDPLQIIQAALTKLVNS